MIIPVFNSGPQLLEAIASLREPEPLEVVVVDDVSTDPETVNLLARLEEGGTRVLRRTENGGVARARRTGVEATSAPYVFPLDADDLAIPGVLTRAADLLDAHPEAAAVFGDYEEFGNQEIVRAVPHTLDAYRIAYTNEYAVTALVRRTAVDTYGAWRDPSPNGRGYEDWQLWMDFAQDGVPIVHLQDVLYRRRLGEPGLDVKQRARHADLYRHLRSNHPQLFAQLGQHRRRTTLSTPRTLLYPVLYGERRLVNRVRWVKPLLDRVGVWTPKRKGP